MKTKSKSKKTTKKLPKAPPNLLERITRLEQLIEARKKANLELLKLLQNEIKRCPYMRFGQILLAHGFVVHGIDDFYKEPADHLERVKEMSSKLK